MINNVAVLYSKKKNAQSAIDSLTAPLEIIQDGLEDVSNAEILYDFDYPEDESSPTKIFVGSCFMDATPDETTEHLKGTESKLKESLDKYIKTKEEIVAELEPIKTKLKNKFGNAINLEE